MKAGTLGYWITGIICFVFFHSLMCSAEGEEALPKVREMSPHDVQMRDAGVFYEQCGSSLWIGELEIKSNEKTKSYQAKSSKTYGTHFFISKARCVKGLCPSLSKVNLKSMNFEYDVGSCMSVVYVGGGSKGEKLKVWCPLTKYPLKEIVLRCKLN